MQNVTTRLEALEKAQLDAQRGLRRWRGIAVVALTLGLAAGQLTPGIAADGNGNGGGLEDLAAALAALTQRVAATEALTAKVEALESKLARVSVSPDGNDLYVTGANLHVRSAGGGSFANDGTGNLLIGYNEQRPGGSEKSGSHNLVIGAEHNYSGVNGFVGGYRNTISGLSGAVVTGFENSATGPYSSAVLTGWGNSATGPFAVVTGGGANSATGENAIVSGGLQNTATGPYAVVAAGAGNLASGNGAAILGGVGNLAMAVAPPGGRVEDQHWMTVIGGANNRATGWGSTVTGGANVTMGAPVGWAGGGSGSGAYHSP